MAAILCGGCFDCSKGICTCCRNCTTNCGKCCIDGCKGCGPFCDNLCKVITYPCDLLFNTCRNSGPFCIYVTVALGFNAPPIVMALTSIPSTISCENKQSAIWMLVNLLFCVMNICAACYLAHAINNNDNRFGTPGAAASSNSAPPQSTTPSLMNRPPPPSAEATTFQKASYLLCYDKWIAMYMIGLLLFLAWIVVGVSWKGSGAMENTTEECNDMNVWSAIGFDAAFIILGFGALLLSLCISCFHTAPASQTQQFIPTNQNHHQSSPQATQAATAKPTPKPQQQPPVQPTVDSNDNVEVPFASAQVIPDPIPPPSAPAKNDIER